jgi:hypothetical protein
MDAELTKTIRDASGNLHTIGQLVHVLRVGQGRALMLVQFDDQSHGYVFPEEIEVVQLEHDETVSAEGVKVEVDLVA